MEREAVKIYTAQDSFQADLILETLKSADIPAYSKDTGPGGFMAIYAGKSMCGEEIFVAVEDTKKAAEILADMGIEICVD